MFGVRVEAEELLVSPAFDGLEDRLDVDERAAIQAEGAATLPGGRPRYYTLNEVINLPPVEWSVPDVWVRRGVSAVSGAPASGKSAFVQDMTVRKAAGLSALNGTPVTPGGIVYFACEGFGGLGQRLRSLLSFHSIAADADLPLRFRSVAPSLLDVREVDDLLADLAQLPFVPEVVVVDTLSRTIVPGNENDSCDMARYVAALDRIRTQIDGHVCVVHHTGWNQERERGSNVLRGGVDTSMLLTREDATITLACTKQKDAPEFKDMRFALRPYRESIVLEPVSADDAKRRPDTLSGTRQKALEALRTVGEGDGASFTRWLEPSGLTRATFTRCVADLVSWGLIEKRRGKYVVLE